MEEQSEEYEVLESIYGSGDDRFKAISPTGFQYKFGEDGGSTSFLLEIKWPLDYPTVIPEFTLDTFFNQHLSPIQKSDILKLINSEADKNLGQVQTYTMIEWVREHYEEIVEVIKNGATVLESSTNDERYKDPTTQDSTQSSQKVRKEHLTKNQKRREWDRLDAKGEKPRGHDWVDVLKHLAQSGGQA